VTDGQLDVIEAPGRPEARLLDTRGPGEFFGEMSLISLDRLRTASVRTRTEVKLFEMTRTQFNTLVRRRPAVAFEIARSLRHCLHDLDKAMIRALEIKNLQLARA
jgi:CRP-like cAMP-binding protein